MDKLSELSKPVGIHPEVREFIETGINDATTHDSVDQCDYLFAANLEKLLQPLYSQEYVSALLAELEASKKSNAFLKEQLAKLANFNPDWDMLEACRESWREVAAALKEAEAKLEAKDKCIAELEAEITNIVDSHAETVAELRAKLATPVRLTDERTLWAGEDDYDTGHVKGWNDCRAAMLAQPVSSGYKLPEGWKLVPVEPTAEMINAALASGALSIRSAYRLMLAAAPEGGNDHDTRR
ncbi:hypothetical protein [Serratia marcescens]|uniref:hypothetical protein n=1 Tax=Serratia marcescens TaxID=615 RepID=UPI00146E2742|nr:hypothetical protein [Serratia marcescens]NMT27359.1 hypothetical protein [Serratia marcescens]